MKTETASSVIKATEILVSLKEVSVMTRRSSQILVDWFHKRRELFDIVIAGCVVIKTRQIQIEKGCVCKP